MLKISSMFAALYQLSAITRYSKDRTIERESVLEHTGWVAAFSLLFAESSDFGIDIRKLMTRAIFHDLDEIITGDIPRVTKYASENITREFKTIETKSIHRLEKILGFPECDIASDWGDAKDLSKEGLIISIADILSVVYKCWIEIDLFSNPSLSRVALEARDSVIPEIEKKISTLEMKFPDEGADKRFFVSARSAIGEAKTIIKHLVERCESSFRDSREALNKFHVSEGEK